MTTLAEVCEVLEAIAPVTLAEEWDNVGLLVGDSKASINRLMTCLTVTPESAQEAIQGGADLIVAHHPLPFRPLKRITTDTTPGCLLWQLIQAGVSIYSPHTAFDSTSDGINHQLALALGLRDINPLAPCQEAPDVGGGRYGKLEPSVPVGELVQRVRGCVGESMIRGVWPTEEIIQYAAVACGSAGEFLPHAHAKQCQLLVTGETSFHTCLEAKSLGMGLMLLGHYASERFAVVALAEKLRQLLPSLDTIWCSESESDPIRIF